ncbi:hypothetical protein [Luedemannella helvata]|uniref:Uncharacterized protein n=1 Tax=Luedemannella helvata TaxID=349315 RepID=A0ABN2KJ41_9ACTN
MTRPLYARMLRLRRLNPGPLARFGLLEGMILLGALLALSELAPWWLGLSLPLLVAGAVKLVDALPTLRAGVASALAAWTAHAHRGRHASGDLAERRPGYGSAARDSQNSVADRWKAVQVSRSTAASARDANRGERVMVRDDAGPAPGRGPAGTRTAGDHGSRGRVARGVAPVPAGARPPVQPPAGSVRRAVGAWPMPVDPADSPPPFAVTRPAQRTQTAAVGPPAESISRLRRGALDQLRVARARLNRGRFSGAG